MTTISIPEGYQYVGATLLSTVWVLAYQVIVVSRYRKRAKIPYPQLYAEKAEAEANPEANKFNCAQRAHQNTLENLPVLYTTALIAGLKQPLLTAAACAIWSLGRVTYTRGYITGDPKKRVTFLYQINGLCVLGLVLLSTYTAGEWVVTGILKSIN